MKQHPTEVSQTAKMVSVAAKDCTCFLPILEENVTAET